MADRFRVRVFDRTKRCHTEARDYSEGEASVVMEHVRSKNGWGFLALITPEKSVG
jgi:hypothetical protein